MPKRQPSGRQNLRLAFGPLSLPQRRRTREGEEDGAMATNIKGIATGVGGESSHIAMQPFSSTEVLTALKNGSGNLELIGWRTDGTQVMRRADSGHQAGEADEVALALAGRQ